MTRLLRTEADIRAAGAAAVADWPPLSGEQIRTLAALLAPIADQPDCWRRLDDPAQDSSRL